MESFEALGLPEFLAKNLKQMNFTQPTPVQAQAIPAALLGKDVIASAQTGTGKTAGFGIPLITFLEKNKDQTALILTPTRELAVQVLEVLRKLSGVHPLGGSVLLIGGANMAAQFSALTRKPRLVIGTPGRVIDHLNRGSLRLDHTGFLVLDEADRMLDMGFAPQLEEIRKRLQPKRQTLLFSATIPNDIQKMASRYLKDPVRITIGSTTQPLAKISQMIIHTTESKKFEEMMGELQERQGSILVFARTQVRVDRLADKLKDAGLKVTRIHGGRTQSQRRQAIDQFREGKFLILVATDIAARGLDIHHIAHVINYDLPRNPEDYVHRIGRTARAGAEGDSLCLLTPEDKSLWDRIAKLIGVPRDKIKVKASRFGFAGPRGSAPPNTARSHESKPRHFTPSVAAPPVHKPRHFTPADDAPSAPKPRLITPSAAASDANRSFEAIEKPEHRHEKPAGKQRHPDGRHQRRSEGHQRRMGLLPADNAQPAKPGMGAEDEDRQPDFNAIDNRGNIEQPIRFQKPAWNGKPRHTSGGQGFDRNRTTNWHPKVQEDRGGRPRYGDKREGQGRSFSRGPSSHSHAPGMEVDGNKPQAFESRVDNRPFGSRNSQSRNDRRPSGDRRPSFGDKRSFGGPKPFGEKRSFGSGRPSGDRPPFRSDRPSGDRRPGSSRPAFGDKRSFSGPKPFGEKRSFSAGRPSGDRPPFRSDRPSGGDRRPSRFGKSNGPKTSYRPKGF